MSHVHPAARRAARGRVRGRLSLSLACLATPALAAAQTAPRSATVAEVIVTARPDPDDPPVVAETRRRLSETPGAVSVISAESYESRFATALDDALRDAPGVYAQRKWGGDIRLSIRGSGIGNANHNRGLLLAQDGVPLNEADGYGDSQIADPLTTRLIEVHRGGNALRFGGALLGGAINMVTPTGADAGYRARVRVDGGSHGLVREHLALAQDGGDWDAYGAVTNQTGQGPRPQSQQNLQFASVNVGRRFGDDGEVRLILNAAGIKQEIPGALTRAQFETDPEQAAPGNYANDQARDRRAVRGSLRTRWRLGEGAVLEGAAYGVWKDLDHPIFQVIDQQSRNYGAFVRVDLEGALGGRRADAFVGAWARTGDLDSNFYVNLRGARGAPTSISLQSAAAVDVFGEGRLFVTERVALVAGATAGWTTRDYRSFAVPGAPATFNLSASRDYDWVAPRVGLLWEAPDGLQAFANLTRSVEPPNFSSLSPTGTGFAPVEAQKAWTAEVGTRGRRGPVTFDLVYYHAWLEDELLQYTVAEGIPASTFNADETTHQGVEAGVDWRFADGWRLRQTYTWSDFRFEGDVQYGNNRLPIVPEHMYRAELRYDAPGRWFVAPSLEWSAGALWVDYANRTRAPEYAIVNLNTGVNLTDTVAVFAEVRNLEDEAYVSNVQAQILATAASAAYWPGDGRSIYGGLTWAF